MRDAPVNRKTYPLSGTLKCGCCGTGYIGDNGIYRCNSKSKAGLDCDNHGISQAKIENAIFTFVSQKVLNFRNVAAVVNRIKDRFKGGNTEIEPLEKRLVKIEKERERVMGLYRMGLINEDEVQDQLAPLNLQKQAIQSNVDDLRASEGAWQVSKAEIEKIIGSLAKELRHADPINKKRVIQTLFREIQIFPKEGTPWRRKLTIKGVYLPLTGLFVASPRGFEPLSPA